MEFCRERQIRVIAVALSAGGSFFVEFGVVSRSDLLLVVHDPMSNRDSTLEPLLRFSLEFPSLLRRPSGSGQSAKIYLHVGSQLSPNPVVSLTFRPGCSCDDSAAFG